MVLDCTVKTPFVSLGPGKWATLRTSLRPARFVGTLHLWGTMRNAIPVAGTQMHVMAIVTDAAPASNNKSGSGCENGDPGSGSPLAGMVQVRQGVGGGARGAGATGGS